MLRLSVSTEEYLLIGDNIKIAFLGGSHNHMRIMIDAPKEVNIIRSSVLEKDNPELKETGPKYYAEPELPERYRKKKVPKQGNNSGVFVFNGPKDKLASDIINSHKNIFAANGFAAAKQGGNYYDRTTQHYINER